MAASCALHDGHQSDIQTSDCYGTYHSKVHCSTCETPASSGQNKVEETFGLCCNEGDCLLLLTHFKSTSLEPSLCSNTRKASRATRLAVSCCCCCHTPKKSAGYIRRVAITHQHRQVRGRTIRRKPVLAT